MVLLTWGCAGTAPLLNSISGTPEIEAGQRGYIRWSFSDADSVTLAGQEGAFDATDITYVTPRVTTTYRLTGHGGDQSTTGSWTIRVVNPPPPIVEEQTTPPDPPERSDQPCNYFFESTLASDFLMGYASGQTGVPAVNKVKIMRVAATDSNPLGEIHAVLLDEYGNYLPSMTASSEWKLAMDCYAADAALEISPLIEEIVDPANDVSLALCVDNAAYMAPYAASVDLACQDILCNLTEEDEISLYRFDHRVVQEFEGISANNARSLLTPMDREQNSIVTALYRAAYAGLSSLASSARSQKALILITGGVENASLVYTINDVAQQARSLGVTVYTIAIGDGVDTYALRYIASQSGGRYYSVNRGEMNKLQRALGEIVRSYKSFYRLQFDDRNQGWQEFRDCQDGITARLRYNGGLDRVEEGRKVGAPPRNYDPHHQILAVFDYNSTDPPPAYHLQFDRLAAVLLDNPGKSIEIVGHASLDGSDAANLAISRARAQNARRALTARGVSPAQLRIRASGARKPVYYLEGTAWQSQENRRVEIRWLDPELEPFELLAQTSYTEEEAISQVEEWENRGINAYYELILIDRIPAFRVKLWGYRSNEEASNAGRQLQTKYGIRLAVQ